MKLTYGTKITPHNFLKYKKKHYMVENKDVTSREFIKMSNEMTNLMMVSDYLDEYSEYFQHIERKLFVGIVHHKKSIVNLKTEFLKEFGINARQFNSIKSQVNGKISSIKKLKEAELLKKQEDVEKIEELIKTLNIEKDKAFEELSLLKMTDNKFLVKVKKYRYIKNRIHNKKRKLNNLKNAIKIMVKDNEKDIVRICFGSKDLFKKQHNLEENGYKKHGEWLKDWKNARSNQCMFIGSCDETLGNQNCQYDKKNNLTITVANKFKKKYGSKLKLDNITFKYGQKEIDNCKDWYMDYSSGYDSKKKKYYNGALTYRFYRNENGWYLYATTEVKACENIVSDPRIGALGLDFNVNFVLVTFIDRFGNPIDELKLRYLMYGRTTNQIKDTLLKLVVKICELARMYRIPIYIEDLDFQGAKRNLDKGKKYNRMINSFPYKSFREALEVRAFKTGVTVKAVNPTSTSVIGQFKFMKKYGLSSHGSAGCIIARRGLGLKTEKISKRRKLAIKILEKDMNMNIDNYKMWLKLGSIIKKNIKFNDRINALYANML